MDGASMLDEVVVAVDEAEHDECRDEKNLTKKISSQVPHPTTDLPATRFLIPPLTSQSSAL